MRKIILSSLVFINLYSLELDSIDVGFKSIHYKQLKEYNLNENNLGVIFNFDNNISLGYINKNSFRNESYIVSYKYNIYENEYIKLDTKINLISGYKGYSKEGNYKIGYQEYLIFNEFLPTPSIDITVKNIKIGILPEAIYLGVNYKFNK